MRREKTNMSKNRLGIETIQDTSDTVRIYHVNSQVSNIWVSSIGREQFSLHPITSTHGTPLDDETRQMVDNLFKTPAISAIGLSETYVRIVIRSMFYWHEAQNHIIDAMLSRLGWTRDDTDIMSVSDFRKSAYHFAIIIVWQD